MFVWNDSKALSSERGAGALPTPVIESPVAADSPALEVQDLRCSFGGVQAVSGASLVVARGEFVGLIGPNGAGKSTLVDCITGVNRSYSGTIRVLGHDVRKLPVHSRAKIGLGRSFQSARLFGRMTTTSNIMLGARPSPGEHPVLALLPAMWRHSETQSLSRVFSLLHHFGLINVEDQYASELSGGQERLVELARSMMARPEVLILDEPFAGVSPSNRRKLARELVRLCKSEGVSMLMVEHRMDWVRETCDRVVVMANGDVLASGSLDDIAQNESVVSAYLGRAAAARGGAK